MKKNGFTLVELLAVIVILAIILAIAIPSISTMMNSASESALESSAKLVLKGIEYEMMENSTFDPTSVNEANIESALNIDDSNYQSVTVKKINGVIYVTIVGKNKWDKLTVSGTKAATKVVDTVTSFSNGANAPVLTTGLTPIKWDGTAWVDTTESDTAWYNYDNTKQWANAKTADGSMWVWIPRFIYRISTGWHTSTAGTIDIQFTKGVDDNWNKAVIGDIVLDETANASNTATNTNKYTNHPAFTFGDAELTGFWAAKFEASGTTTAIDSKPNIATLRSQTIGALFTAARNMETNTKYGWGTSGAGIDTHMMKNSEWGAVTYLTQSTYGKNAEVWINNSSTYTTGCAGSSVSAASFAGCENTYNTANGLQASTTGNIYGIYDMSGGAVEYVAAHVSNDHANLAANGSVIINAESKYRDVYSKGATDTGTANYDLTINKKGDAMYEISASSAGISTWNGASSNMPKTDQPWFIRGGSHSGGINADIFYFYIAQGNTDSSRGFRPTISIEKSL